MTATVNAPAVRQDDELKQGIRYERRFASSDDPYEGLEMELRDVVLKNAATQKVSFEQRDIMVPKDWDQQSLDIFAQHYLRGQLGTDSRETSVLQTMNRIGGVLYEWAQRGRTIAGEVVFLGQLFADEESANSWLCDLLWLLSRKYLVFNSPVYYNIGVPGVPQQGSACFILNSDLDDMKKIAKWNETEIFIFKGGSGSGIDVSRIRSSYEGISGGGKASGPCSYMRGTDSFAGTMKSGGRSRRAAKMVVAKVSHPDILEQSDGSVGFIGLKSRAEQVARVLRDAGFDMSVDSGHDAVHVQYQNANNSVRYTNAFMEILKAGGIWQTTALTDNVWKPVPAYPAEQVWKQHAKASWECGDPGVQFDDTANHWHTSPEAGRNNASNPCSEYMHLDQSPCNLANTNLIKFVQDDGSWDSESFMAACRVLAIAQTVIAAYADYPDETIGRVARGFRQIGQGWTNLGAVAMSKGLAYDSDEARAWAAVITAQMQGSVGTTSGEVAAVWGAYPGVPELGLPGFDSEGNRRQHINVVTMHLDFLKAVAKPPTAAARRRSLPALDSTHIDNFHNEVVGAGVPVQNDRQLKRAYDEAAVSLARALELGQSFGWASAYWSNIPPMGTSGIVLEQDTSGAEPAYNVVVTKKKVSGDWMQMTIRQMVPALVRLGYSVDQAKEIEAYAHQNNSVVKAPHLSEEHYAIFDTANKEPVSGRYLTVDAHIKMLAAIQPLLSGATSKTINLPNEATVEDFERSHFELWRLGVKAGALYRDGSKATQPLVAKDGEILAGPPPTVRYKLPREVDEKRVKISIPQIGQDPFEAYLHIGFYPNGQLGEVWMSAGNEGTTINGFLAAAMKWGSIAAQHGTPAAHLVKMWLGMKFEPHGQLRPVDSPFTSCTSPVDLVAKELALLALTPEERYALNIYTRDERAKMVAGEELPTNGVAPAVVAVQAATVAEAKAKGQTVQITKGGDFPICYRPSCGGIPMTEKVGACWACPQCGMTDGCS